MLSRRRPGAGRYILGTMPPDAVHEEFMRRALDQARLARDRGEVPIGTVIVLEGRVVGEGFNQPIGALDPTAHAEIVALRQATKTAGNYRLPGATAYVTVEPCLMCVGALVNARVAAVVYGTAEPKWGALVSLLDVSTVRLNHRFETVAGVLEAECRQLMVDFFKLRRAPRVT
jgi:haloalkane dehalogenase/tRNA(adenine34) deaminase